MDRNNVIGLVLIFLMLLVYFQFLAPSPQDIAQQDNKPKTQDSTQNQNKQIAPRIDTTQYGSFAPALQGEEKEIVLENKDLQITFSNKGGRISKVLLKGYQTYDQKPLLLFEERNSQMQYQVNSAEGSIDLYQLFFEPKLEGNQLEFSLAAGKKRIIQRYTLAPEGFLLDYEVAQEGNAFQNKEASFLWKAQLQKTEEDLQQSRIKSTINYSTAEGGFDFLTEASTDPQSRDTEKLEWMAFQQKFFLAALLAPAQKPFPKATVSTSVPQENTKIVKEYESKIALETATGQYQFYFGPNQYRVLSEVNAPDFVKNIGLGWAIFGWVNRFLIIPIFNFLESFIGNYGLIIVLLVVLIKTLLFPLVYRSYTSMAKMRVLKPELDAIKEKNGDDMQKNQVEQMELYRQVGINPLSGCVPMLLQMPILFAMFVFFPNAIELRQESFLWAHDLSTYDAIVRFGFEIPFYGNHVSMFTLMMTASTIVYTWYNNQNTPNLQGPMKTMGYIMPLVFLFVLNSYSAGLTFYYFCSNMVSIGQQLLIRKFVDESKIRQKLDENRKKNKEGKKSSFQQRLEEAMKAKAEAQKNKNKA